jgi:hypothetical protein
MADGFLLTGSVFFDPFDENGNKTGLIDLGNTTSLTYSQENGEVIQRIGRKENNYNKVIGEVRQSGTPSISLTGDEFNRQNLAFLFLGEDSDLGIAAGTFSGISTLIENRWVQLEHANLTEGTMAIADKTEGTDFEVNYTAGLIKALNAATEGEQTLTYDYGAYSGFKIKGNLKNAIRGELLLVGKNLDNNHRCQLTVFDISLVPDSDFDFLVKDQYATMQLKGSARLPNGQEHTFEYLDLGVF